MSSKTPTLRETAWISMIPHVIVMSTIIFIYYSFNKQNAVQFGAFTYIGISISLRYFIPQSHRAGIKCVKEANYEQAISKFKQSYAFFSNYKWIDDYRYITLLTSSKISYREMALCNIAFCYGQLGDGKLSKQFYVKTLQEYPDSGLAKTGINFINSISKENIN